MSMADKKIIAIFRSFIEKVFVPQLPKMDIICQVEWNKFSNLLSSQQLVVNELQFYVDNLPNPGYNNNNGLNSFNSFSAKVGLDQNENKSPFFMKPRRDSVNDQGNGFNVLRTFGGEKNRIVFQPKDYQESPQFGDRQNSNLSKDFSKDRDENVSGITTQFVLPTLQKLFKSFNENQLKIEKIGPFGMYQGRSYNG